MLAQSTLVAKVVSQKRELPLLLLQGVATAAERFFAPVLAAPATAEHYRRCLL
jgi:hypothetical protein